MKKIISKIAIFSFTVIISLSACKPNGDNNSTDAINSTDEIGIDSINNATIRDTANMRDTFNNPPHDTTVPPL